MVGLFREAVESECRRRACAGMLLVLVVLMIVAGRSSCAGSWGQAALAQGVDGDRGELNKAERAPVFAPNTTARPPAPPPMPPASDVGCARGAAA